jgi:hypothetical protein
MQALNAFAVARSKQSTCRDIAPVDLGLLVALEQTVSCTNDRLGEKAINAIIAMDI